MTTQNNITIKRKIELHPTNASFEIKFFNNDLQEEIEKLIIYMSKKEKVDIELKNVIPSIISYTNEKEINILTVELTE